MYEVWPCFFVFADEFIEEKRGSIENVTLLLYKQSLKKLKLFSDSTTSIDFTSFTRPILNDFKRFLEVEQGFKLNSKSDPYFQVPDFFLGKSAADDALRVNDSRLAEMTGVQKQIIEDLFGKGNDAFQTILNGTNKLSGIVRRNEYFDNLLNTSNELVTAV